MKRVSCIVPTGHLSYAPLEPANAIKFSIRRERPAGGPGEHDVFGCQQYGPLFDLEIPV
jgi:hypothetical protein